MSSSIMEGNSRGQRGCRLRDLQGVQPSDEEVNTLPIIIFDPDLPCNNRGQRGGRLRDLYADCAEKKEEKVVKASPTKVKPSSSSTRSGSPRQAAVNAKRKIITKELELTSSEDDDDDDECDAKSSPLVESRPQSPSVPSGQYEIEDVLDYVKEDVVGEMYLIKWKDWESTFNTWEPPANLVNCDDALFNFYRARKAEVEKIISVSEYFVMPGGKRRRKGPPMLQIPPDPRPLEQRLQEFYDATNPLSEEKLLVLFTAWNKRRLASKSCKDKGTRWPAAKLNKYLTDGTDGKLSEKELNALRQELYYVEIDLRKSSLTKSLQDWQVRINTITENKPFISVENEVDFVGPPEEFQFASNYIPSAGIVIPNDPPVGCSCTDSCYENRNNCCGTLSGSQFAYTKYRKVAVDIGTPIWECNSKCTCGPQCPNRVVQDGKTDVKLCIFRTSNGCGWGVKALKSIKRGCFVTLYVGEVIYTEEAEKRSKAKGDGHTYLFDLDFNDQENPVYSVDASKYGNVAHFINHSCDPNLGVYAVWVDCLDPNLPKLAMFAIRDIAKGEELSFDYTHQNSDALNKSSLEETTTLPASPSKQRQKCFCASANCRKYLFT